MSSHGKLDPAKLRRVIMPVEDDDEIADIRNYQDIRMELKATGHNLVRAIPLAIVKHNPFVILTRFY